MTLTEARQLRDEIRATGRKATAPDGAAADEYKVQVWGRYGVISYLRSRDEWIAYQQRNPLQTKVRPTSAKPVRGKGE